MEKVTNSISGGGWYIAILALVAVLLFCIAYNTNVEVNVTKDRDHSIPYYSSLHGAIVTLDDSTTLSLVDRVMALEHRVEMLRYFITSNLMEIREQCPRPPNCVAGRGDESSDGSVRGDVVIEKSK